MYCPHRMPGTGLLHWCLLHRRGSSSSNRWLHLLFHLWLLRCSFCAARCLSVNKFKCILPVKLSRVGFFKVENTTKKRSQTQGVHSADIEQMCEHNKQANEIVPVFLPVHACVCKHCAFDTFWYYVLVTFCVRHGFQSELLVCLKSESHCLCGKIQLNYSNWSVEKHPITA